ncbi:hypothetical protein ASPZODRAFT_131274 [Penicilliopsis zonata CBS 506.65]|uniref:Signal recognition particle subunit SRP68 n=1 Tax=Penicilliopsis zonata CBS 506.65 TaxID=1073090 RepID=A0A1L9SKT4_9EURO|nr:hypothetical protein ASPZODRAFT_131274 [Penicilliopsis zonata CBS 506.65]OJJ47716.1 hypothetical protein ASPZODRAFT_131274 [Penicilliopsis zonata CBS 506.65]
MEVTDFIFSRREEVLLTGDYNAYRAQSSRRLHKLRRKLGQTTPKGRKYVAKRAVTAEDVGENAAYVHLLLVSAERAWAQAMHMKATHSAVPSAKGITGAARRHIVSRLNKAAGYARELVQLLQDQTTSGASETDVLEARAYLASLFGALYLEKQRWEDCLRSYSVARVIYTALGQNVKKDAFRDLLSGTVDPSLRYAAYQMKLPRSKPLPSLAIDYFPADSEIRSEVEKIDPSCLTMEAVGARKTADGATQQLPETITWRSRTVALEDASISQALAAASTAESRLASWLAEVAGQSASATDKAAAYDQAIIASQDAVDATKTAIDELTSEGVDPGDRRIQALQITRTAVNYALIGWRVGRNRVLCGEEDGVLFDAEGKMGTKPATKRIEGNGKKLTKLREQVVLYDSTLQSLDFILELPGVAADSEFVAELDAKRNYFRALRCLAIGRSHGLLAKSKQALALHSKALELVSLASTSSQTDADTQGPPRLDISRRQIQALETALRSLVAHYRGLVTIENLSAAETADSGTQPLIERLSEYAGDGVDLAHLVPYPPQMQPIPVKPLFLDVAWNYIDYPREQHAAPQQQQQQQQAEPEAEEKKGGRRGWFGFGR